MTPLTLAQAAEVVGLSVRTLEGWVAAGDTYAEVDFDEDTRLRGGGATLPVRSADRGAS
ncbi:MAG: hypothetical protein ACRDYU_00375 [Actinomycetes bacterium]